MKLFPSFIFITLLGCSALSHSAKQDVIYKKDGSVLRGELIEQDFNNGVYKIELMGGSVFVIKQSDIEKITKEETKTTKPSEQTTEQELNDVAQESRAKLATTSNNQASKRQYDDLTTYQPYSPRDKSIHNTFYIGLLSHSLSRDVDYFSGFYADDITLTDTYTGLKLGYQHNFSKHLATHISLRKGSLDSIEYTDEDYDVIQSVPSSELPDTDYYGASIDLLLSTNHYEGFQLFTGLGISHDEYSGNSFSDTYSSLTLDLGVGYAWKPLQVAIHYQGYISDEYPDEVDVSNIHLQVGVHF